MTEIQVGNYTISEASTDKQRLAMILWGKAGDGKTTLAATAPGNKLWIQFDDSGTSSIAGLRTKLERDKPNLNTALKTRIYTLDISKESNNYVAKFSDPDAFSITPFITNPEYAIETIVVDSLTSLGNDVLNYHIKYGGFKGATLATPGLQAYGARLSYLKAFITNLLKLTKKYDKNIIFISHEGAPTVDQQSGSVTEITLALGGNLPQESALQVGEVWYVRNSAQGGREIFVTPFQTYKPMKSRMFDLGAGRGSSFKWLYDIADPNPKFEIATWFNEWVSKGYEKLDLPK